jgi:hypothetical protein
VTLGSASPDVIASATARRMSPDRLIEQTGDPRRQADPELLRRLLTWC